MPDIIVPTVTPFTPEGKVDLEKLKEHVTHLVRKGVDVIFLNGTTGMGPALSPEEKLAVLKSVYDVTNRVIFQVGGLNLYDVVKLARESKDFDIVGVASYPPYYFPRMREDWVLRYFRDLCAASPHPVYLYNYPLATGFDVSPALAKEIGCLKGVKDTTQDLAHPLSLKRVLPDLKVYTGADTLVLPSMASGLDGVVSALGNYAPELLLRVRNLVNDGKLREAVEVQQVIAELIDLSRKYGSLAANYVLVRELQGHDVGVPRPPVYPVVDEARLRSELEPLKRRVESLK
ncbi:2-dehydro-3-deoxy-phosphogluconate aldolase [Sulfodiicoccus acidiphilus]|nr:bifunctional 2-dehydro-3-deoxy-phosphogluconate/2-dehydro-3-deoxy-6-phosphogalactonate aldolase [Sulfodiicoccus acidiphilus]BBD73167.1 2-dehydro-3-deoxy-phosphogluconate aldolase [Sulfodiicoccus acidiphilus]